jgi:hypothetical protein
LKREPAGGRFDDAVLVNGEAPALAVLGAARPVRAERLRLGGLLHAAGLHLGPALHALELGDLLAQLTHRLLQRRVPRHQALGQSFKLTTRQV